MNENDGSDGFAGVLPGGMRERGNRKGQTNQKKLKDQKSTVKIETVWGYGFRLTSGGEA